MELQLDDAAKASAAFRMTPSHGFVAGAVLRNYVSIFEEVSHKKLLLEVWIFSFRGRLAEFARLQDPDASGPEGS